MASVCRIVLMGGEKNKTELLESAIHSVCSCVAFTYVADEAAMDKLLRHTDEVSITAFVIDNTPAFSWTEQYLTGIRGCKGFEKTPIFLIADNHCDEAAADAFTQGAQKYIVRPATYERLLLFVRLLVLEYPSFAITRPSLKDFVLEHC